MNERIINVFGAQPGSYALLMHKEQGGIVLPVVGWVAREKTSEIGETYLDISPLVSNSLMEDTREPEEITDWPDDWDWKTFAPGENAHRWIEIFEKEHYRISSWDVSNWWPSKSPIFATADEMLWTDDLLPPDDDLLT
jgi:hypothetical protein